MGGTRYLPVFSAFSVGALLIANIFGARLLDLHYVLIPAGLLIFPLAPVISDIVAWVYGRESAFKIVLAGSGVTLLFVAMVVVVRALPTSASQEEQRAFDLILLPSIRIAMASIVAMTVGGVVNAQVVYMLRQSGVAQSMASVFFLSTAVAQATDNLVFLPLALGGVVPVDELMKMGIVTWAAKVGWEILALPLSTWATHKVALAEGRRNESRPTPLRLVKMRNQGWPGGDAS